MACRCGLVLRAFGPLLGRARRRPRGRLGSRMEAIFGFVGVLVGAFSNWLIQRGSEGRSARRRARQAVRLLKPAAERIQDMLRLSLDADLWWTAVEIELPLERWRDAEPVLADVLPNDDWDALRNAFGAVQQIESSAQYAKARQQEHPSDMDHDHMQDALPLLAHALRVLSALEEEHQTITERVFARRRSRAARPDGAGRHRDSLRTLSAQARVPPAVPPALRARLVRPEAHRRAGGVRAEQQRLDGAGAGRAARRGEGGDE